MRHWYNITACLRHYLEQSANVAWWGSDTPLSLVQKQSNFEAFLTVWRSTILQGLGLHTTRDRYEEDGDYDPDKAFKGGLEAWRKSKAAQTKEEPQEIVLGKNAFKEVIVSYQESDTESAKGNGTQATL